jgi:hypothetical protein
MWLPIIGQDRDVHDWHISWGSMVLAWMYHQLCDACRRSGGSANLGGCVYHFVCHFMRTWQDVVL